jgi:hypothetical protein
MKTTNLILSVLIVSLVFSSCPIGAKSVNAPFDVSQAAYYDRVKTALSLTPEQELALVKNGFVVVGVSNQSDILEPRQRFEDFYYEKVYRNDLPVFVTTDSILHLFHVMFDCSLKTLEMRNLYPLLLNVTQYAFSASLNDYNSITHDNSPKYWAIRNSTVYFAVGLALLTNSTPTLPVELLDDVDFFTSNAWKEEPDFLPAGDWTFPERPYWVSIQYDFTQFKVRGHYLGEARLEQYFRTFMWYGQFPVFIPRNDENYAWSVPHFNETFTVHVRDVLKSSPEIYQNWMQLYNVTGGLVGESDSINPLNLEIALQRVFGNSDKYMDHVLTGDGLAQLREELSKPEYAQQILSQALLAGTPNDPLPNYPIVFQFMGQRYVPDSFIFQMLCWDKVGRDANYTRRILPRGVDVFAVLGSERASQLLIPDFRFSNFTDNLGLLKENFQNLTEEDWTHSSYTAWVHALQSLVEAQSDPCPDFMKTPAWQDEKLNTGLASWAQLRHDTLLYAKQTYIPGWVCSYPEAFVEPYPTFYSRMQRLSQRTLEAISALDTSSIEPVIAQSLNNITSITKTLETISLKELAREPLTPEEVDFIKQVAWRCGSGGFVGWYVDTIHAMASKANYTSILDVPVIADVATFPPRDIEDPPQILHVGTGYVNALVVLFPKPDGTLVASVGPVFSYHEFRLIGTKRLNDNEWKDMLALENGTAYVPECFRDIYGAGEPWPVPEYGNSVVFVAVSAVAAFSIIVSAKLLNLKRRKTKAKN